jgi:hypothetical protein
MIGCANGTTDDVEEDPTSNPPAETPVEDTVTVKEGVFSAAKSTDRRSSVIRFLEEGTEEGTEEEIEDIEDLILSDFPVEVPIPFTLSNVGNTPIDNVQIQSDNPSVIEVSFPSAGQTLQPVDTFAVTVGFSINVKQTSENPNPIGPNSVTITGTYIDEEGVEQTAKPYTIKLNNYVAEYQDWKFEWSSDNVVWTEFVKYGNTNWDTLPNAKYVRISNLGTAELAITHKFNAETTIDDSLSAGQVNTYSLDDINGVATKGFYMFDIIPLTDIFQVRIQTHVEFYD